ncbi:MAG: hypothetical protein ACRCWP_06560 [Shewanella sp.]
MNKLDCFSLRIDKIAINLHQQPSDDMALDMSINLALFSLRPSKNQRSLRKQLCPEMRTVSPYQ